MLDLYILPGNSQFPLRLLQHIKGPHVYYVQGTSFPPVPCTLFRQLLAQIRLVLPAASVTPVLERYGHVLALVLGSAADRDGWRAVDVPVWRRLSARLTSHLTHNYPMSTPLIEACAALIRSLLANVPAHVVIGDYTQLDENSLRLITELVVHPGELHLHWSIGLPEKDGHVLTERADDTGIQWASSVRHYRAMLYGLKERLPLREHHVDPHATSPETPWDWERLPVNPEDQQVEWQALQIIKHQPRPLATEEVACVFDASVTSFQVYAFTTALFLGLHALDLGGDHLTPRQRAVLHGICAVAAHNRQFFSEQNTTIAHFIHDHLTKALALEDCPGVRCAHFYRLAVTASRRFGNCDQALAHIESGMRELRSGTMDLYEAKLAESWLHNIKSYCLMRLGQAAEAEQTMQLAYHALSDVDFNGTGLEDEARLSCAVVVENTMKLMRYTHQPAKWHALQKTAAMLGSRWEMLATADYAEKADLAMFELDLPVAIANASLGLEASMAQCNSAQKHYFASMLGELLMRVGRYAEAVGAYLQALELPQSVGVDVAGSSVPLHLACARAMTYLADFDRAEHMLLECLQGKTSGHALSVTDALYITCRRAELACRRHDQGALQALCTRLAEQAFRSGDRRHLAMANAYIAHVSYASGDYDTALTTARNGWKLCADSQGFITSRKARLTSDVLETTLLLFTHPVIVKERTEADWRFLITMMARVLRTHTSPWLYLPVLMRAATAHARLALLEEGQAGRDVLRAAEQRQDYPLSRVA